MCKRIIVLLFFLSGYMKGQDNAMTPYAVDTSSYRLYTAADRQGHEALTRQALNEHIDFYYLRIRAGLLEFSAKKYFAARNHLERALFYYPADTLTQEYLFYTYLNLGENQQAADLFKHMTPEMKEKLQKLYPTANAIYVEAGYFTSNASTAVSVPEVHGKPPVMYSEADQTKNIQYYQLGLNTNYSRKTSLYFGFTYVNLAKEKDAYWGPRDTSSNYHYHQFEYYLGLQHAINKNWQCQFGFHYLDYKSTVMYSQNDTAAKTYRFFNTDIKQSNMVLTGGLSYTIRDVLKPSIDLSYSRINKLDILQASGRLTYYLTGNKHLYGVSGFTYNSDGTNKRQVIFQKLGGRLAPKLWLEVYGYGGDLTNFNDANGFLVYNVSDKITGKYGASLSIVASRSIDLTLRYDLIQRVGTYDQTRQGNIITTYSYNYSNNAFIGSVRFKF